MMKTMTGGNTFTELKTEVMGLSVTRCRYAVIDEDSRAVMVREEESFGSGGKRMKELMPTSVAPKMCPGFPTSCPVGGDARAAAPPITARWLLRLEVGEEGDE